MTTMLVSAAARRTLPVPASGPRVALAARAAAQHAGLAPAALDRITTPGDTVPSASAFQSAL
ncbi:hypothetical protein [Streptomyces sp. WM6378]|uniref:hypothetical protein n=1 Tax=Streptomyces sp. WM6378 TaxID=1415557 RepID=UPI0006AF4AE1|nr:hypothetical protein [Streptomyces sp. WM6378]KOU47551.1 hypothetical protein ADK54_13220 [Streptomyces sp. WM6378]